MTSDSRAARLTREGLLTTFDGYGKPREKWRVGG